MRSRRQRRVVRMANVGSARWPAGTRLISWCPSSSVPSSAENRKSRFLRYPSSQRYRVKRHSCCFPFQAQADFSTSFLKIRDTSKRMSAKDFAVRSVVALSSARQRLHSKEYIPCTVTLSAKFGT